MSYQFLIRNTLNSDKYNHNEVKHPLGRLILNTEWWAILASNYLVPQIQNISCLPFWIKYVMKKNSFLLQWRNIFFSQASPELDLMFQKQKTKQRVTTPPLTSGDCTGIGVLSLKLHKYFMKTVFFSVNGSLDSCKARTFLSHQSMSLRIFFPIAVLVLN